MPDGGEHIKVGACPYCATRRIRLRRDVRPYRPWRCRVCNKVFRNPKIVTTTSHSKARRRGYVLAKRIPWLERDSRRLRKRLRKQKLKKVLTIAAGAMGVLAVVVIAAQLRSSSEPPSPVELAVSNDRAKVLAPTPEALATVVRLLEVAAAQVDTPAATPNPDPLLLTAHQTVANTPTTASTATPIPAATASSVQALVALTTPTTTPAATLMPTPTHQTPRTRQSASAFWTPTPSPTPTPTNTATPTATPSPTPAPHPDPSQRHIELKRTMLDLVNEKREQAGVPPLVLGDNPAAQLHADESLANCTAGHWDAYGTKPYMRYSAAGGYQSNGENSLGNKYCPRPEERYALARPSEEVADAVEIWMNSPGHHRAMLDPAFKKLNIGLAWSGPNFYSYHHFEGDYVEFDALPAITSDGMLHFAGRTKNGARIEGDDDVYVAIHYDPPLKRLTRGQLAQAHCYPVGVRVASLLRPLTGGRSWPLTFSEYELSSCIDPYDIDPDAPAPTSHLDAGRIRAEAKAWSAQKEPETVSVPWITATVWKWEDMSFEVEADISEVLRVHGDGIYTLMINAQVDGKPEWIAQYSIFRGVEPPDIYQLNTN